MLTVGSLFSGIGLLDYGLTLAGLDHRWFAEVDPFRRQVLARRWPGVRIYDDVRAVGADAERVDVVAGGFPCKGASTAGKRNGFGHPETRLWREMARAVGELRPRFVVIENVANLLAVHDGALWAEVLGDLATLGFDVQWDCVPAAAFGAPHLRDRVLAVAEDPDQRPVEPGRLRRGERGADQAAASDAHEVGGRSWPGFAARLPGPGQSGAGGGVAAVADPERDGVRLQPVTKPGRSHTSIAPAARGVSVRWREYEPAIRRWEAVFGPSPEPLVRGVDDGRTSWVERSRLSALGDGVQVQLGELVGRYLMSKQQDFAVGPAPARPTRPAPPQPQPTATPPPPHQKEQ